VKKAAAAGQPRAWSLSEGVQQRVKTFAKVKRHHPARRLLAHPHSAMQSDGDSAGNKCSWRSALRFNNAHERICNCQPVSDLQHESTVKQVDEYNLLANHEPTGSYSSCRPLQSLRLRLSAIEGNKLR
jgi:hypothetical protein